MIDVSPLTIILFLTAIGLLLYWLKRRADAPRRDSRNRNRRQ